MKIEMEKDKLQYTWIFWRVLAFSSLEAGTLHYITLVDRKKSILRDRIYRAIIAYIRVRVYLYVFGIKI